MTQDLKDILEGELGDVTDVSVASSNGFAGVSAGDTSPVVTIKTTVNGILVGNGTSIAAAVAADFPTLNQNTTGNAATATYATSSGSAGTASSINGVSLASLATGILKNTTGTGIPSIAVQADVTSLLGAGSITNTMLANGAVANLSGTNTGDNSANSLYASDYRAANFVAGTDYVAPGGALGTPSSGNLANCTFPTLNQNTTGNASTATYATSSGSASSASNLSGGAAGEIAYQSAVGATAFLSVGGSNQILTGGIASPSWSSTLPTAAMPALTGDLSGSSGSLSVTVTKINGTSLSGLATGILKNTTGTGVPSIAVSGTDYASPNQTMYVGTTALAINRASGAQALTGITSIDGNAATVTTNANLTGPITSTGNATAVASQTGTGSKFVMDTSPVLVTPNIGVATASSLGVGTLGYTPAANTTKIWYADTQNNFINAVIQNKSTGTAASSDLVCTTDAGTDSSQYIDMGVNCTGWTGTSYGAAKDGYLYVDGGAASTGNLLIGTAQTGTKIKFQAGTLVNASAGILELTNTVATVGGSLAITGMATAVLYSNSGMVDAATIGPGLSFSAGTLDIAGKWYGNLASTSGTSTITPGTSAPTTSDGTQIFSQTLTPTSTSQKFHIEFSFSVGSSEFPNTITIAVFRGSTFLGASVWRGADPAALYNNNTYTGTMGFDFTDAPATTSSITYSARIGINTGTWYLNRREAENTYGGTNGGWKIEAQ